jgi:molybdate transport system substrate-binding protein
MTPPRFRFALMAAILLPFVAHVQAADKVVRVSAAASLGDVLKVIDAQFEKLSGIKVELNLGASNVLARQIEEGAPVDIFFSADLAKMEGLDSKGLIDSATKESQLSNALVVVVPGDSSLVIRSGADVAGANIKKLAVGDPKAVPAGIYAKEWLTKLGLWSAIEPKLVSTESVRAALAAVESGNVEAGIVYKTDASISKKVKVALEVPATEGPQIIYPMALIKGAAHAGEGHRYLEFMDSREAKELFEQFGFIVLPEAAAAK